LSAERLSEEGNLSQHTATAQSTDVACLFAMKPALWPKKFLLQRTINILSKIRSSILPWTLFVFCAASLFPNYSGTRVDVSRNPSVQVDATPKERRPCTKLNRAFLLLL
jgi:hypothetical protein